MPATAACKTQRSETAVAPCLTGSLEKAFYLEGSKESPRKKHVVLREVPYFQFHQVSPSCWLGLAVCFGFEPLALVEGEW